jgi:hypothetical protein
MTAFLGGLADVERDNRRREPMAAIRDHGHAEILSDTPLTPDPVSVTMPAGGVVKLNNHSKKLAGIDVRTPARSLPGTQPLLVPKT